MIEVRNLRVGRDGKTICKVDQLAVAPGERVAVIGPNGSGKTTLLRVLAQLTSDYSGTCRVQTPRRERTYMHQHPYLFRGTVLANVRFGRSTQRRSRAQRTPLALSWLRRLGVDNLAKRTTRHLSGGEIRRIALARALAFEPKLLLLDEPLAELDPQAIDTVCRLLNELPKTTIIIASPVELPKALATTTFQLLSPS